jgi:hypothetical protein
MVAMQARMRLKEMDASYERTSITDQPNVRHNRLKSRAGKAAEYL